jgi:hypothetical protein
VGANPALLGRDFCFLPLHFSKCVQDFEGDRFSPRGNAEREQQRCGEAGVLDTVQRNPQSGVRRMSMMTGVALAQVWRILHTDGFYPHHLQRIQHLLLEGHTPCVHCFEWLQAYLDVLTDIFFNEEAQFTLGIINSTRNSHSLAHKKSSEAAERYFQRHFSVDV